MKIVIISIAICLLLMVGLPGAWADDKGFISAKDMKFDLCGELEYEFVDTERDKNNGIDEPNGHFQVDKFVLKPIVQFEDYLKVTAELEFTEDDTVLNEVHAKFTKLDLPCKMWLDVGLYERWISEHVCRPTEGYPLIGTAFWRDDANTVTLGGEFDIGSPLYWMVSLANGYTTGTKQPSEDSSYKILHDDHSTGDYRSKEFGVNLGYKDDWGDRGKIDILAFTYIDRLSDTEITPTLQTALANYTSSQRDKTRMGAGVNYALKNLSLYGQYIQAEDGRIERDGWYIQASYKHKFKDRKSLLAIEPVIMYSVLDVDWPNKLRQFSDPEGWDRKQITCALITDLYKNVKLKTEYYINQEDTGTKSAITGKDEVDNNEWLVQIEIKF